MYDIHPHSYTCLLHASYKCWALFWVLNTQYVVGDSSPGFFNFCKEKEKNERLCVVQFEQVHHVDGPTCTQIVVKYI